jgi:glycosyltransferase involved in cell wall biosynthesis
MGFLEDGWHSSRGLADGLAATLPSVGSPLTRDMELYAPRAGHAPGFADRRWRYGRDAPRARILHLLDQSYGDAVLRIGGRFEATVVYVADLAFWYDRTALNSWLRRRILAGLKQATCRVAMSHGTAREMAQLGLRPDAIAYPGVDPVAFPHAATARIPGRLLHVGSTLPRKGIDRALRLLAELPSEYHLLQLGGRFSAAQRDLIEKMGINSRVTQQPYAEPSALLQAYQEAEALIFPSRYEGFGLPVIEARLTGTRVVTCDTVPAIERLPDDPGVLVVDGAELDQGGAGAEVARWLKPSPVAVSLREKLSWRPTATAFSHLYSGLVA